MSSDNYFTSIPVFKGAQGKYYLVDGIKYHIRFPIAWALNHKSFEPEGSLLGTGPIKCENCATHGTLRGVFVGYCGNCLEQYCTYGNDWRGPPGGHSVKYLQVEDLWAIFPYMTNVYKEEIGDEEGADLEENLRDNELMIDLEEDSDSEQDISEVVTPTANYAYTDNDPYCETDEEY